MAVDWTITIEGKNEFGDTCRRELRIDKAWESLFDGDIGLSVEDGKKIMAALQSAVVNHEAEIYPFSPTLPRLSHIPAGQRLYDTPDPNGLRHGKSSQSSLDAMPGMLPGHGRRPRAAEGNLSRSGDVGADGVDSTAGEHDALPAGGEGAGRIPAH